MIYSNLWHKLDLCMGLTQSQYSYLLHMCLYGRKQSPRAWFEKFIQSMKKQENIQGQTNHILFTKSGENEMLTWNIPILI